MLGNKPKLHMILIAAAMAAAALTGLSQAWLGNENVRASFYSSTEAQLASTAEISARSIERHFEKLRLDVGLLAEHPSVVDAMISLSRAFAAFGEADVQMPGTQSGSEAAHLRRFYEEEFSPTLSRFPQSDPLAEVFMPDNRAAISLQARYVAQAGVPASERVRLSDAGDGSGYSREHARVHDFLSDLKERLQFFDLFLIDPTGRVVYSVIKEVDFMTDLQEGPFNDSGLANLYANVLRDRATRPIHFQDYSFYLPSYGAPSFFVGAPIFDGSRFAGVLVVQASPEQVQNILSEDETRTGLGEGGDVIIVSNDGKVRSSVRPFEEDREAFLERLLALGVASDTVERMGYFETPINLLSAAALVVEPSSGNRSGIADGLDGDAVINAVAPMDIAGLDWAVVATLPKAEADRPVAAFQRTMMLALAATVAMTTLGATVFANRLTRPMRHLTQGLRQAAGGKDVNIVLDRTDELGELSRAAQALVDADRAELARFEGERVESFNLLSRFLPERVVRYFEENRGKGLDQIGRYAEPVENATYVMGKLSGYKDALAALPPDQAVAMLDELVRAVDAAADTHGVEKVRTAGDTYFAVAGLSNSLIDHRRRALAFARDLRDIVRAMGGGQVGVGVALVSGTAISGVIGRQRLAFDLWGPTVESVRTLLEAAKPFEILVDEEFSQAMRGSETTTRIEHGFRIEDAGDKASVQT